MQTLAPGSLNSGFAWNSPHFYDLGVLIHNIISNGTKVERRRGKKKKVYYGESKGQWQITQLVHFHSHRYAIFLCNEVWEKHFTETEAVMWRKWATSSSRGEERKVRVRSSETPQDGLFLLSSWEHLGTLHWPLCQINYTKGHEPRVLHLPQRSLIYIIVHFHFFFKT